MLEKTNRWLENMKYVTLKLQGEDATCTHHQSKGESLWKRLLKKRRSRFLAGASAVTTARMTVSTGLLTKRIPMVASIATGMRLIITLLKDRVACLTRERNIAGRQGVCLVSHRLQSCHVYYERSISTNY